MRIAAPLRAAAPVALAAALAATPRAAAACSLCIAASSEATRQAFLWTTGLLTFVPLLMIGAILWWLVRRARAMAEPVPTGRAAPLRAPLGARASAER